MNCNFADRVLLPIVTFALILDSHDERCVFNRSHPFSRMSFGLTRELIVKEHLTGLSIAKALVPDRERNVIEKTYAGSINNLLYLLITRTSLQQNKTVCQNGSTL